MLKTFCGACATMVSGEGVCPLRTVCGQERRDFFRCGCLNFLLQKT